MQTKTRILALLAMGAALGAGAAHATGAISILPGNGGAEKIDDRGGAAAGWGLPLGLTGYNSVAGTGTAANLVLAKGRYKFTYVGNGDAADMDTFTVSGPGGFSLNSHTALGATFYYTVKTAGDLPFTFANVSTGTSISDSDVNPTTSLSYGLFMANSFGTTGLTGPGWKAYVGLSDLPWGSDHDFQDLGVLIQVVPEPASWALMLLGLGGLGAALRTQRKLAAARI